MYIVNNKTKQYIYVLILLGHNDLFWSKLCLIW